MANLEFSNYIETREDAGGTLDGTEILIASKGGEAVSFTTQQLIDELGGDGGGGTWGSITGTLSNQTDLQNAFNAKLNKLATYRTVVATHELDATDLASISAGAQLVIILNAGAPLTLEIPTNAVQAFPQGTIICGIQYGTGQVTIAPDATVTMRSPNNANKSFSQYSRFYLEKIGADLWLLSGDITV